MAKIKEWGPYLTFGLLSVLLTTIGGIILTAWKASLGLIVGISVIILAWVLSAYVYRYFDSRPDVVKARKELKDLKKKSEKYITDLESMRTDYTNMKSKIDEAVRQINDFNYKMQHINMKVDDATQKVNEANQKAEAGFWMGAGHWAKEIWQSLNKK